MFKRLSLLFIKLFLLWILVFDFQRILFSIHHWDRFKHITISEWLQAFAYSIRLDIATASSLVILPLIFGFLYLIFHRNWMRKMFNFLLWFEFVFVAIIHSGEINAYTEWNHKLTSRVFMHLSNPDEVVRSADYSMTVWFFVYLAIELLFAWRLKKLFFRMEAGLSVSKFRFPVFVGALIFFLGILIVTVRGGIQQIPININSAFYSKFPITNDLSTNSLYFFSKSFLLYNRSEIDEFIPKIDKKLAEKIVKDLYTYPTEHDQLFLTNKRPNIVFVVLESWVADAVGCLGTQKGATPHFDKLSKEGILFSNVYSTSHTSEIGNASIFSGFPGIPEVSISMQPEKSRKLKSINQSLKPLGYTSGYLFSGDLKYGNIGGFFMDHGFDVVKDENDFSSNVPRGKLNYFDQDLYTKFIDEINHTKQPFIQCAFTGSTHSPFDHPKRQKDKFVGEERNFMNSVIYADQCIGDFIKKVKKQKWFDNTLFVFVADHGHATPNVAFAMVHEFYRIPLLFWGNVIKPEFKGKRIDKIGSQADLPLTLLHQMGMPTNDYPWSKDLMNPAVPEFAFHTIIRGYGWGSKNGYLTYEMQMKSYLEDTFSKENQKQEKLKANAFLKCVYQFYNDL
jgi:phosphoglycerol transferase MdoB-like AlkP superfamily enzyme